MKHVTKLNLGLVSLGCVLAASSATAATADGRFDWQISGAACQISQSGADTTVADDYGLANTSYDAPATVVCAVPNLTLWTNAGATLPGSVYVAYSDDSNAQPFWCYSAATTSWYYGGFSTTWNPTKYTCSQQNGCPDSTSEFRGTGQLQLSMSGIGTKTVRCGIPAAQYWRSQLLNLYMSNR
jgi:hypothetical protein